MEKALDGRALGENPRARSLDGTSQPAHLQQVRRPPSASHVVAPVVLTQGCRIDGCGSGCRDEGGPDLVGGPVAVALEQPRGVVGALEV
jgi:hypothetical protein